MIHKFRYYIYLALSFVLFPVLAFAQDTATDTAWQMPSMTFNFSPLNTAASQIVLVAVGMMIIGWLFYLFKKR